MHTKRRRIKIYKRNPPSQSAKSLGTGSFYSWNEASKRAESFHNRRFNDARCKSLTLLFTLFIHEITGKGKSPGLERVFSCAAHFVRLEGITRWARWENSRTCRRTPKERRDLAQSREKTRSKLISQKVRLENNNNYFFKWILRYSFLGEFYEKGRNDSLRRVGCVKIYYSLQSGIMNTVRMDSFRILNLFQTK